LAQPKNPALTLPAKLGEGVADPFAWDIRKKTPNQPYTTGGSLDENEQVVPISMYHDETV
jgi:hypothetical protein